MRCICVPRTCKPSANAPEAQFTSDAASRCISLSYQFAHTLVAILQPFVNRCLRPILNVLPIGSAKTCCDSGRASNRWDSRFWEWEWPYSRQKKRLGYNWNPWFQAAPGETEKAASDNTCISRCCSSPTTFRINKIGIGICMVNINTLKILNFSKIRYWHPKMITFVGILLVKYSL